MNQDKIKRFLDIKVKAHNQKGFIANDPISIPHQFTQPQDVEISALFAALLAWGNRKSIINSGDRLINIMEAKPYQFITEQFTPNNKLLYKKINGFVHRTFNHNDLWHLFTFLHHHFVVKKQTSLETAFTQGFDDNAPNIETALIAFRNYVFNFNIEATLEQHCKKHISTPEKKSACKRLCMYLRWMVRSDKAGVDFGLWKTIKPHQLVCPLDVHVATVSRHLGIIKRKQNDWLTALELTEFLKTLNPADPVVYDYALFGLGANDGWMM
jgi:uncharacterized protein (TIGR02757 family)